MENVLIHILRNHDIKAIRWKRLTLNILAANPIVQTSEPDIRPEMSRYIILAFRFKWNGAAAIEGGGRFVDN